MNFLRDIKKLLLFVLLFLYGLSRVLAQESLIIDSTTRNVRNPGFVNFADGKLKIGGVAVTTTFPTQTGHSGEYLTTNGTAASWAAIPPPSDTAFGPAWNADTTIAPSKNAIYDWAHLFDTDDDGKVNVLDQTAGIPLTDANGVLLSPITDNSANWNTAYIDRNKWDGGATGLTAATGRTSLGGTTVGQALFTLGNPSAITFVKIAADNSVSAESASAHRTSLGLVIGTNVQAYDADLDAWAGITPASGIGTFLAAPSLANLKAAITDETTVGWNLLTLANPGAITFLQVNADNTVTAQSANAQRIALSLVPGTDIQTYDSGLGLVKPAVAVVATSNLTLSGEQTIDGITTSGSLVLATAQTTGANNGPWISAAGAWTRPTWFATGSTAQAPQFLTTFVRLGTTYSGSTWRMTTGGVTIGTTAQAWVQTPISLASSNVTGTLPAANLSLTKTQLNTIVSDDDPAYLGAAQTFTAAQTNSTSGAASAPAMKYSGVPFAGTGTTSFPLFYINDANATASTTLNTAGTYFGVNGDGTQDLMNLLKDGTSVFKVASTGTTTGTSFDAGSGNFATTGALITYGAGTSIHFQANSAGIVVRKDSLLKWNDTVVGGGGSIFATGSFDTGIGRNGAGGVEVNTGTAGQWAGLKLGTRDSGTTTVTNGLTLGHQSTGTPAAGLGEAILGNLDSSTTPDQNAFRQGYAWQTATHASRASYAFTQTTGKAQTLTDRTITGASITVATNNTALSLFDIALPTLKGAAGTVTYRVFATDGTDVQTRSGIARYSAVNKAASYTSETAILNEAASVSAGTLTATVAFATGTNLITFQITPNTSLTPTTYYVEYTVQNLSESTITVK
ncbi:MAG: hypothetical protein QOI07_911 [Verrucomicrobiota bacterium]|jgi:hypothetical protein